MTATNKRLLISESHDDSNRCTPCRGKPDQYDMYVSHVSPRTPGVRSMLPAGGPYTWQPFTSRQQGWTDALLPRKSVPDSTSQPGWVIRGTHLSFSPNTTIEAVCLIQAPVGGRLLGLPGPYHRHAISRFNTCSQVATPRSLTDTDEGYHIENLKIAIALSPPFPFEGSTDPPNGPARSQIIQQHLPKELEMGTSPKTHEWEAPLDFYHHLPSTHCMS
jgi:hypothetical protein